jgi:hypothetical protein
MRRHDWSDGTIKHSKQIDYVIIRHKRLGAAFPCRLPKKQKLGKHKSGFPNFDFPNFSLSPIKPVMVPLPSSYTFLAFTRQRLAFEYAICQGKNAGECGFLQNLSH